MTALINLTAMLIIGLSMANYTSISAWYAKQPTRLKITLEVSAALTLMLLMMNWR